MTECSTPLPEECSPTVSPRTLFRSNTEEALKGGPLMKSAINEGNLLFSALLLSPVWLTHRYFLLLHSAQIQKTTPHKILHFSELPGEHLKKKNVASRIMLSNLESSLQPGYVP